MTLSLRWCFDKITPVIEIFDFEFSLIPSHKEADKIGPLLYHLTNRQLIFLSNCRGLIFHECTHPKDVHMMCYLIGRVSMQSLVFFVTPLSQYPLLHLCGRMQFQFEILWIF